MHTTCNNCNETCSPLIDVNTLSGKKVSSKTKAICDHCRKEVNLTSFAIKSLFSMKRFYQPKPSKAYQYFCKTCNAYTDANLSQDNKQALCADCNGMHEITPFALRALQLSKGVLKNDQERQNKKLQETKQKLVEEQQKLKEQSLNDESAEQESSDSQDIINLDEEID